MKSELLLVGALVCCAVQAQALDKVDHAAWHRTTTSRVASSPGDALPFDSLNCRLVGQYAPPYAISGLDVVGNLAYLATGDSGLRVIDVSDPASLSEVGHCATPGTANCVVKVGNYAYVSDGDYLCVIDVSNPAHPVDTGNLFEAGWLGGLVKEGNYVYVTEYHGKVIVMDVSDPVSPTEVGRCTTPGYANGLVKAGNYVYVADQESGLVVIDVSNPVSPYAVGRFQTPYVAEGVEVFGSHSVCVADGTSLRMIDVSNPASPSEVGYYDQDGYVYGVDVVGGYAYTASTDNGLYVIDVSDPANPLKVGFYPIPSSNPMGAIEAGGYVYVARDSGLRIIEFYGGGVEEGRRPPACSRQLNATIVRGVLWLPAAASSETQAPSCLLDAVGRRVIRLRPGPNDVQHLSPGVYFVSSPGSAEKVVLTR